MANKQYGKVERGKISKVTNKGYCVASLDREGIETLPLISVGDTTYHAGEKVYFSAFSDGTGVILSHMTEI